MNFFVASFTVANSDQFRADHRGNLPMVGNVVAGKYHTSIFNGTVFVQRGLEQGRLYLCHNTPAVNRETGNRLTTQEGVELFNVEVVSEISVLDLIKSQRELGEPFRITGVNSSNDSSENGASSTVNDDPKVTKLDTILKEEEIN